MDSSPPPPHPLGLLNTLEEATVDVPSTSCTHDNSKMTVDIRADADADALTPAQLHALFDILTHYQAYSEIRDFRDPKTISEYGEPFVRGDGRPAPRSAAPVLQHLVMTFGLPFVGVRNLSQDFWSVELQGVLGSFAEANLSESYDKGAVGARRTLSTIASSVIESATRGCLGGHAKHVRIGGQLRQTSYDMASAASLQKAWDDLLQGLVYGDLIDELVDWEIENEDLEAHSPVAEAAVRYIILHLAAVMHQIFVVSPEGQYLVKMIENLHKLLPYSMIRQTLRLANAATMINGLVTLLLGKFSIGSISNWIGATTDADDGLTLLQRIVSMILSWDSVDFKKAAEKVKKSLAGPSKAELAAIEEHLSRPREEQERIRTISIMKKQSIVMAILEMADPNLAADLLEGGPERHAALLEYYSARLSMRDRDEIARVLCRSRPDLPTRLLRDVVAACDPLIREMHAKVPLHEHMVDLESFVTELIETCRGKRPAAAAASGTATPGQPPSVTDFVDLMQRNKHMLYKFLHHVAKGCPEMREEFRDWCNNSIKEFRVASPEAARGQHVNWTVAATAALAESGISVARPSAKNGHDRAGGAGAMSAALQAMFAALPPATKAEVAPLLERHEMYLEILDEQSSRRMQAVLDDMKGSRRSSSSSSRASDKSGGGSNGGSRGSLWSRKKNGNGGGAAQPAVVVLGAQSGPGRSLVRWRDLMDEALITASAPIRGPVRRGRDVRGATAAGKSATGGKVKDGNKGASQDLAERLEHIRLGQDDEARGGYREAPDVTLVVEALGPLFKEMLQNASERQVDSNSEKPIA
ncbi:hypothetical protein GGTG_09385 [Gaeumannomyces tritici R3-111a-1]|uniref:PX domain-containing protein n=1 Tax=Gaeumannomyces tritici (strain R3-111a-1) TaxID=644352 RepID=J3P789_GAET3|nr:hypothetical protein GGTG_09385 [Gaeumannomyces tritici R3-111a-1]EJT72520.1 hypothetical protein GGTG_09385 [Gaeumannomyces tritici R3-111a-1]